MEGRHDTGTLQAFQCMASCLELLGKPSSGPQSQSSSVNQWEEERRNVTKTAFTSGFVCANHCVYHTYCLWSSQQPYWMFLFSSYRWKTEARSPETQHGYASRKSTVEPGLKGRCLIPKRMLGPQNSGSVMSKALDSWKLNHPALNVKEAKVTTRSN